MHSQTGKQEVVPPDSLGDFVAQLVEHNTFNVGALGSSPSGITEKRIAGCAFFMLFFYCSGLRGIRDQVEYWGGVGSGINFR